MQEQVSSQEKTSKRNTSLDILRIVACYMVIFLHVAAMNWYSTDINGAEWKVLNFYDSAVRSSAPLFFMLSGNLFLNKSQMPTIHTLLRKYISKLFVMYLVWGMLYAIDAVGFRAVVNGDIFAIVRSFVISPKTHLWYLPTLVGIYLMMPVMWCVAKYENGKYLPYACVMFLVFGVTMTTVKALFSEQELLLTFLGRFSYEMSKYSGYFLLGYYLSKRDFSRTKTRYLLALLFVLICVCTKIGELDAVAKGKPQGLLYSNLGIPACVEAILIYIVITKEKIVCKEKITQSLAKISRCTLFIYLFHMFVRDHLDSWFGLNSLSFTPVFSVPLISLLIFVICYIIANILLKVPGVNKWLL